MGRIVDQKNALKAGLLTVIGLGALSGCIEASGTHLQAQGNALAGGLSTLTVGMNARKRAPQAGAAASGELHQVVTHLLDPDLMSVSITSFVEEERQKVFLTSTDAAEDEKMYPGFGDRVRRRLAQEVRSTVIQKMPELQSQYENLLRTRFSPEDIKALLAFQHDPVSMQLRDPAFLQSIKDDHSGRDISQRMEAKMTPQQRAFSARFLQSQCGRKFAAVGPQLEALKNEWVQRVLNEIARRLPAIGDSILEQSKR